jgi:membrane-anchored glycerophosphoryl diester phosphodiesterase (GDPDase)
MKDNQNCTFWVRTLAHTLTLFTETFIVYWLSGSIYEIIMEVDGEAPVRHNNQVNFAKKQSSIIFMTLFGGRAVGCLITGMIRYLFG